MIRSLPGDSGSPDERKNVPAMSSPCSRAVRQMRTADDAVVLSQAGEPRARHDASHFVTVRASESGTYCGCGMGRPDQRLIRETACVNAAFLASRRIEIGVCENQRSNG